MINQKINNCLVSLANSGIQNSYSLLADLILYTEKNLSQLDRIQNYYWAGAIFAIACYEKLPDGNIPRLAYYCLSIDAKNVEPENRGNRYNMRATIERLQLLTKGGMKLIEEKTWDIKTWHKPNMTETQIFDFAMLSDVLKLQEMNFQTDQQWWINVQEDSIGARNKYPTYTNQQIIDLGSEIQSLVADKVRQYLETFYGVH